ncbi:maleylpyruvate isomerase family mycothiol-dependent enzyme [Nocardia australiensis]|uniref:maleylpyruvate isomerase family mycothiol-dependent enzyme n=1 Tax=Nocardia australiensis TaxID=2887191 RepID=UPI001D13DA87|nr:maleylpyruvate isomerase family mycothiol-dependent enzyme [Nocardia australiensis]
MTDSYVEDLARANTAVGELIAEIRSEQWKAPTPCTEWDVRDVVNHLVVMNLVFVALLGGTPAPERGVNHLGDDPVAAYRASAAALEAAFAV